MAGGGAGHSSALTGIVPAEVRLYQCGRAEGFVPFLKHGDGCCVDCFLLDLM